MKTKSILALLFALSSATLYGQLTKGSIFIQGSSSIGFSSEKYSYISGGTTTESSKTTDFGLSPKVGYFVIDNLPVGLVMNIDLSKTKSIANDDESSNNSFTIGPFARYYFLPQEKLMPMGEVYIGFGSSKYKSKYSSYNSEDKYGLFQFSVGAGASYFITEQIAFDMLIAYKTSKYTLKSETSSSGVKSTSSTDSSDKYTGIGINIGIVVTIP